MTEPIKLYNPEEVQAIVDAAIVETMAAVITTNKEAARALKREQKRAYKKSKVADCIKQVVVLGFPAWCGLAITAHWLFCGY